MPLVSANSAQIAIVKEDVAGQTPSNPVFQIVRTTGETLIFEPNTTEDEELSGTTRSSAPADVTGMTVNGDISFVLAKAPWFDMALSGVLASTWGECPVNAGTPGSMIRNSDIAVGQTLETFTIEKRFPDPVNPGDYVYQRYVGSTFSAMTLNIAPNETVTGSFTVVGGIPELGITVLTGATYISAGRNPKFTAPKVVTLSVGSLFSVGTHCWNELVIALDSQNRGVPCIGSTGDRETVLGKLTANVAGNVYFVSQEVLQYMLDNQSVGEVLIELNDSAIPPNVYSFQFFKAMVTAGSLNAGGTGEDLAIPLTLEPTPVVVCQDANGNDWESSFIASRAALPTIPPAVTAVVADTGTAASTVTFTNGPIYIPMMVTVTATTDAVTDVQSVSVTLPTDTTNDAIPALVVAAITAAQGLGTFTTDITPSDSTGGVLTLTAGGGSATVDTTTATFA